MSKFNKRKAKKKLKLIKIRERVENDFNNFFLSIWDLKKKTTERATVILSGSILLLYPKQINSLFVGIFKGEVSYYITAILNRF